VAQVEATEATTGETAGAAGFLPQDRWTGGQAWWMIDGGWWMVEYPSLHRAMMATLAPSWSRTRPGPGTVGRRVRRLRGRRGDELHSSSSPNPLLRFFGEGDQHFERIVPLPQLGGQILFTRGSTVAPQLEICAPVHWLVVGDEEHRAREGLRQDWTAVCYIFAHDFCKSS
jgi:hypothetical protein